MATTQTQLKQPLEMDLRILYGGPMPDPFERGTVFVFDSDSCNAVGDPEGKQKKPNIAKFACPVCGDVGLITCQELYGAASMICGGETCSAEYHIDEDRVIFRRPQ